MKEELRPSVSANDDSEQRIEKVEELFKIDSPSREAKKLNIFKVRRSNSSQRDS